MSKQDKRTDAEHATTRMPRPSDATSKDGVDCDVCGEFVPDDSSIHSDKHGNVGHQACCDLPKPTRKG